MFGTKKTCRERAELESKISECIGSLAELTVNGPGPHKKEAEDKSDKAAELAAFQKAQTGLNSRLRTLRECLDSHRDWHRC